ncbi:MAG: UDP-glucose 6-dehydrogenase [Candidatus Kerfeldbacteria bacterium RIFCSPHIGHO2_12_FULL_48_17]|uniref:UDP-glucose 6-dehydrogenase n=1 Tax=Candidatus Kerfeldbacteria bacterium RIFCSPHIGHO2_12_FULL_48_17 TaxID=1798542 RepID=A0A1G2B673_9BACT|nr:MAG: UDP-glucose 6-dehydrogenase [Candidatus Kerfeldbacteria bacterium RIFCSPHIGHO2_12_FULL_48_17]
MKISVVGTGYVGLVTGTCLADIGHYVTCVDIDEAKIAKMQRAKSPIFEEGLEDMMKKNIEVDRLHFTTRLSDVLAQTEVLFIAVGTPSDAEGKADLQYVEAVAHEIGKNLDHEIVVANKSTVPVGTARMVESIIRKYYHGPFEVVSCPEFLREGTAVYDFYHPDRVVIGARTKRGADTMLKVFEPIKGEKVVTSVESSEMIKYASNAFLATKISFINEIANICERVGADIDEVAYGMGLDTRIGNKFLRAGLGYGGSCFPKDVRALSQIAGTNGYEFKLLKSVIAVNNDQRKFLIEKLERVLGGIRGKKIAVFGLAFKNNTDDVRESAALDVIELLQGRGVAEIRAFDPQAMENAKREVFNVQFVSDPYDAATGADAVIIATEWEMFSKLDWARMKEVMRQPFILDGRNILDVHALSKLGFTCISVGKGKEALEIPVTKSVKV